MVNCFCFYYMISGSKAFFHDKLACQWYRRIEIYDFVLRRMQS